MLTKTIKLKQNEFTDFKDEFNEHDFIILSGARGSGKSYPVAKETSRLLVENPEGIFIYMRIRKQELATFIGWCRDLELEEISGCEKNLLTRGSPTAGDIKLTGLNVVEKEVTGKDGKPEIIEVEEIAFERVIGKCISLETSADVKSGKYDNVLTIVFEEYLQANMNPKLEKKYVFNFLENVESIYRNRPKRIRAIGNTLKSIPLFDQAIEELTPKKFKNPIKIKIFREDPDNKHNKFLAYLNGEVYDDDDYEVDIDEFVPLFMTKDYIINRNFIYPHKYYIQQNKLNKSMSYRENDYMLMAIMCRNEANNEFYYQNARVEKTFSLEYRQVLKKNQKTYGNTRRSIPHLTLNILVLIQCRQ